MELREARERARQSREAGYRATVPTGYPPGRYFVQVWPRHRGVIRLETATEWHEYHVAWAAQHRS